MKRYALGIIALSWLVIYFFFVPPKFLILDHKIKELIYKSRLFERGGPVEGPSNILVIDIDQNSFQDYNQTPPLNRKALALLLARLSKAKLVVLGFPISSASGTSGDDALVRVLRRQRVSVLAPVRFGEVGTQFGAIANAETIVWLPWKKILPYVMLGASDFYLSPGGEVEGFYPFFSYRGRIISHLALRVWAYQKGFDENKFRYSRRWNKLYWQELSLGLDDRHGISVSPALFRLRFPDPVPMNEVLPKKIYRRFLRKGINVPPWEEATGKICFVGYNLPDYGPQLPAGGRILPLHHILALSFLGLKRGMVTYAIPRWLQMLALFSLAVMLSLLGLSTPRHGICVGLVVVIVGSIAGVFLLSRGLFFFYVESLASLVVMSGIGVGVGLRNKILERRSRELEKLVVKQIKEKTTYLPAHRDWLDIRIKEVPGREVSGSMYDFIDINQDKLALAVADVMDKGTSALMKISYLRGLLRSHSIITHQPGEVVYSINKALVRASVINVTCKFLYVLLDGAKNRIVFSGAGGSSFILIDRFRKQIRCYEVEELIPLGLSREIFYEPKEVDMHAGDLLIFYPPSIFNLRNGEGRTYDIDRLGKLVLSCVKLPLPTILERIASDIRTFAGSSREDFALIGVEWKRDKSPADDGDIYVGISPSEKELLLFYKRVNERRRQLKGEG